MPEGVDRPPVAVSVVLDTRLGDEGREPLLEGLDGAAVGVAEDVAVLLGFLSAKFVHSQLPYPLEVDLHV